MKELYEIEFEYHGSTEYKYVLAFNLKELIKWIDKKCILGVKRIDKLGRVTDITNLEKCEMENK